MEEKINISTYFNAYSSFKTFFSSDSFVFSIFNLLFLKIGLFIFFCRIRADFTIREEERENRTDKSITHDFTS